MRESRFDLFVPFTILLAVFCFSPLLRNTYYEISIASRFPTDGDAAVRAQLRTVRQFYELHALEPLLRSAQNPRVRKEKAVQFVSNMSRLPSNYQLKLIQVRSISSSRLGKKILSVTLPRRECVLLNFPWTGRSTRSPLGGGPEFPQTLGQTFEQFSRGMAEQSCRLANCDLADCSGCARLHRHFRRISLQFTAAIAPNYFPRVPGLSSNYNETASLDLRTFAICGNESMRNLTNFRAPMPLGRLRFDIRDTLGKSTFVSKTS